jgi:CheY-like chemotaxis protein
MTPLMDPPNSSAPTKLKILVVEDDDVTQRLFKRILERNGFDVVTADNGQEGLDAAAREQPHLVLLDLMMPVLDGFGFLRGLRDSPYAGLPVIVTSALADTQRREQAMALGACDYLVKSKFNLNDLMESIRQHASRNGDGNGDGLADE